MGAGQSNQMMFGDASELIAVFSITTGSPRLICALCLSAMVMTAGKKETPRFATQNETRGDQT